MSGVFGLPVWHLRPVAWYKLQSHDSDWTHCPPFRQGNTHGSAERQRTNNYTWTITWEKSTEWTWLNKVLKWHVQTICRKIRNNTVHHAFIIKYKRRQRPKSVPLYVFTTTNLREKSPSVRTPVELWGPDKCCSPWTHHQTANKVLLKAEETPSAQWT